MLPDGKTKVEHDLSDVSQGKAKANASPSYAPNYAKTGFGNIKIVGGDYNWTPKWKEGPTFQRQHLKYLRSKLVNDVGVLGPMIRSEEHTS